MTETNRTSFLGLALALTFGAALFTPQAASADPGFKKWIAGFQATAMQQGITQSTYRKAFAGVTDPDPDVLQKAQYQPEFKSQVWDYVDARVNPYTVRIGREMAKKHRVTLQALERHFGVDKNILLAIWSMESNYGAILEKEDRLHYVPRALATLAYADPRRAKFARTQLIAALKILQNGDISADRMTGSWAGAMGHTQFMPSSYLKYAVDWTGNGHADIWNSSSDAIASTANYLRSHGWVPGLPWGMEVTLPDGFDHRLDKASFAAFRAAGLRRTDGRPLPSSGEGRLFYPAGHTGPVMLLTANFDVIKSYNSSDAYALAVGHLADRIMGRPAIQADWPVKAARLDMAGTKDLQRRLKALGLYDHDADGRVGTGTREAVRRYQISVGEIADGYPTPALLARMRAGR